MNQDFSIFSFNKNSFASQYLFVASLRPEIIHFARQDKSQNKERDCMVSKKYCTLAIQMWTRDNNLDWFSMFLSY